MKKMKKTLKRKWIAALRSGEFKQAKHKLFNEGGYCCLGVLAVQLGATLDTFGVLRMTTGQQVGMPGAEYLRNGCDGGLHVDIQQHLSRINDGFEGYYSFNEIANWIEENL